jgi:hypothetical protein
MGDLKNNKCDVSIENMREWICVSSLRFEYGDRNTLIHFLAKHLRDKNIVKECADGSRLNLDILSDEMIRIIYNYINDTIIKLNHDDE